MMANIWEAISSAISSFTSAMVTGVKAFIELFYTTTGEASQQGFTILGYFALCGIAIGIVWSLIRLVRRLMRVN